MNFLPRRSFATVLTAVTLFSGGIAISHAADEGRSRFVMQQTDDGMLRLDTHSGAMSLCQPREGAWSCAQIEDDSAGQDAELRALQQENKKLKNEINRLRVDLQARPERLTADKPREALPSEEDVDRAFSFVERLLKRFKGMVEDLRSEEPVGTPL